MYFRERGAEGAALLYRLCLDWVVSHECGYELPQRDRGREHLVGQRRATERRSVVI